MKVAGNQGSLSILASNIKQVLAYKLTSTTEIIGES